nr:hypothetical protein [uncultured Flavobacterium sp.]
MNYATSYNIGNNFPTRKTKATAVAPTARRVCDLDEANQRCKRNSKRQTKVSSNNAITNGFLKTVFLPKLKTEQSSQARTGVNKTESDFYVSLCSLATHYKVKPMETKNFGYPYNLALALWDIENKLKEKVPNWDNSQLIQGKNKVYFVSEERYSTGTSLYYIPITPLYRMLKDPKKEKTAHLLLSVCCYLYHSANIPYYRQENSYMYDLYEMIKDWMEEDDENQDYAREFYHAEWIGDCMEQKIFNPANLTVFKERLKRFKSKDEFDFECYKMAQQAFEIFTQYPNESIFRNARQYEEDPDNEQEIITMDKYISFWADDRGWLSQNLTDSINNEFNEYGQIEEPSISKKFKGGLITEDSLDFESRLFPLLNELCYILNNY